MFLFTMFIRLNIQILQENLIVVKYDVNLIQHLLNCIPDAKRGYYGFIIIVVRVRALVRFLVSDLQSTFLSGFLSYLAGGLIW